MVRRIMQNRRVLCAFQPAYLNGAESPKSFDDLKAGKIFFFFFFFCFFFFFFFFFVFFVFFFFLSQDCLETASVTRGITPSLQ